MIRIRGLTPMGSSRMMGDKMLRTCALRRELPSVHRNSVGLFPSGKAVAETQ